MTVRPSRRSVRSERTLARRESEDGSMVARHLEVGRDGCIAFGIVACMAFIWQGWRWAFDTTTKRRAGLY